LRGLPCFALQLRSWHVPHSRSDLSQAAGGGRSAGETAVYSAPVAARPGRLSLLVSASCRYVEPAADTATTVPDSFAFPFTADNLIYSQTASPTIDSKGFTGGVQVGFNYQLSNLVFGSRPTNNAFKRCAARPTPWVRRRGIIVLNSHTELNTDWLFTLRPRAGITFNRFLVYGTGGSGDDEHQIFADQCLFADVPEHTFPVLGERSGVENKDGMDGRARRGSRAVR